MTHIWSGQLHQNQHRQGLEGCRKSEPKQKSMNRNREVEGSPEKRKTMNFHLKADF